MVKYSLMDIQEIKKNIKGDVADDEATLAKYSHDASLFEVKPAAVVFPKDSEDVKNLVKYAGDHPPLSITARSGGTDMTGGPLTESIVLDFTKYFNKLSIESMSGLTAAASADLSAVALAKAEPGVWYRDFEKSAAKNGWLLPSYPASKDICAIGGMIGNNSGGEKTLKYGKTEKYVESLKVVLSDGSEHDVKKITKDELAQKIEGKEFENKIYRDVFKLLDKNYELIKNSQPQVSKNSAGYNIWNVWNKETGEFDLTRLFVGAQGTLGVVTKANLRLIKAKPHSGLMVAFISDFKALPELVNQLLPLRPVSLESFDDHTFKLAMKFFWSFRKTLGAKGLFSLALQFLPDAWMVATRGFPKLVLLAEFEGLDRQEVDKQISQAQEIFKNFKIRTIVANTEEKAKKYWVIRRESFNLLRKRVKGKRTAPFVDDLIVQPKYLPEFIPKLTEILNRYKLEYTLAGHVGNGNFHVIPLMKLDTEEEREKIFKSMDEVYKLVLEYKGSFTAEHNDGLIRTPYLKMMYGEKIYEIFEEIKKIFDPKNIFNPGKKVGGNLDYAKSHIKIGS